MFQENRTITKNREKHNRKKRNPFGQTDTG